LITLPLPPSYLQLVLEVRSDEVQCEDVMANLLEEEIVVLEEELKNNIEEAIEL
jgi:hypothetical protein